VLGVLIVAGGAGVALALRSPNGSAGPPNGLPSADSSAQGVSSRVSDLQFTYPHRYHLRAFSTCSFAITGDRKGGCEHGVVIASYPLKPQPEIGGSGAHFVARGVALELYRPPADNGRADVTLGDHRLSLWQFNSDSDEGIVLPGRKPPPPEQWSAWFRVNGASYWAIAWVGTHAARIDRATLATLINSVHAYGRTPHAAPKPSPQVTRIACAGTARNPRVPRGALAGGSGSGAYLICAQVSGRACHVWTRLIGAPAADVRERHFQLRRSFCAHTRDFLRQNPRGYSVEPPNPGLTAVLPKPGT
jgi:hypothetical protein